MQYSLLHMLRIRVFSVLRAWALRILCATWSKHDIGLNDLDRRISHKERLIVVLWHSKYLTLLPLLRNRSACVFTSLSLRGDAIVSLLEHFGYRGIQLPDHGGERSLDIMRKSLANGESAAIAVDGPFGPYHVVHRGSVQLASELGHMIVPVSVATSRKRTLSSRWDKLEIPGSFAKVFLVVGEPIRIPPDLDDDTLTTWRMVVQSALDDVDRQASVNLSDPRVSYDKDE